MRASPRSHEADVAIGRRLRTARILRGYTQKSLAAALDLTFQQVQKYEKGSNRISAGRLLVAADVLGFDITFFYPRAVRERRVGRFELDAIKARIGLTLAEFDRTIGRLAAERADLAAALAVGDDAASPVDLQDAA